MNRNCSESRRAVVAFVLSLMIAHASPVVANPGTAGSPTATLKGRSDGTVKGVVLNFTDLARIEAVSGTTVLRPRVIPPHHSPPEPEGTATIAGDIPPIAALSGPAQPASTAVPSPAPTSSFLAQSDPNTVIPPDTDGAVGLSWVMSTHNSNYVIQDKTTGAVLSSVSMNSFWAATGATGLFDPKTVYDPFNDRWILTAGSNASSSSSSLCLGVSQTSDPTGSYFLFRFVEGTSTLWADFPSLGFNKNWVAVSCNMFTISGNAFSEGRVRVIGYPALRTGTATTSEFAGATVGFTQQPCVTYSATEDTLFMVQHLSSAGATLKISTITGPIASPLLTVGGTSTNPLGGWVAPGGEILPQSPEPLPGTGTRSVDCIDSRVINAVYRGGSIFYAQTIALPAGGPIARTAAQWVQLTTAGGFIQGGRVVDPTATATNGGEWYAFPSISVNKNNDVLLGFSQFASSHSPSAGYAFRGGTDPAGTMRDPVVFKAGEAYYEKTFSGTSNRWGDFSNSQVDPSNDADLWTIQEYSQPKVGTGNGSGRWGTWWARVTSAPLPIELADFSASLVGGTGILVRWSTISELNNYGFEIQRSSGPGVDFATLPSGFIPGHGTTVVPQSYSYLDTSGVVGGLRYRLKQIDLDGTWRFSEIVALSTVTGVNVDGSPTATFIDQNYPNPFNPSTTIHYRLSTTGFVTLNVYDLLGRAVASLVNETKGAGDYMVPFDATGLASGVYFYRFQVRESLGGAERVHRETRRLMVLR